MINTQLFYTNFVIFMAVVAETTGTLLDTNDLHINDVAATEAVIENVSDLYTSPISKSGLDSLGVVGELASGPVISGLTSLVNLANVANGLNRPNRGALVRTYTNPLQVATCGIANGAVTTASGFIGMPVLSRIAGRLASGPTLGGGVASTANFNLARPTRDVVSGDFTGPEFTAGSPGVSKQTTYSVPIPSLFGEARMLGTDIAVGLPGAMGIPGDLVSATTNVAYTTGEELSQAGMHSGMMKPIYAKTVTIGLPNPPEIINELTLGNPTHIRSDLTNPVATFGPVMIKNSPPCPDIPSKLMTTLNLMDSKSTLARVTGINAANLGAKGKFIVKSSSPLAPTGISILADNLIMDGSLAVMGSLPFLGSVRVDGTLPDGGKGNVLYACGNRNIDTVNEDPASMGSVTNRLRRGGLNLGGTSDLTSIGSRLG